MLLFVAALVAATVASGVWCAGELLPRRVRGRCGTGRAVSGRAVAIAVVLFVAAGLRFALVPPHHAMYVDEPWYAEAACNVARLGRLVVCEETWLGTDCVPYAKAAGWPVLMVPWTMLFGCDTTVGIDLNRLLGVATVLLAAIAARCAGAMWWQSVVAAAVLALHPVHVAWS